MTLIQWLQDHHVRKFLSDSQDVSDKLTQVLERVNLPVVTHLFCQQGKFMMAYDTQNRPVGFVRLVVRDHETEMVLAIGDRNQWGRGLGTSTIRESMKVAFFELRAKKLVAKVHHENVRSARAFMKAGFSVEHETARMKNFSMTMDEYLTMIA
jgi:regulator of nucleoside diphosphate kinase